MGKITTTPVSEAGGEVDWLVEHLLSWPCTGDERDGKSEAYINGLMRQAARRIEALAKTASSPASGDQSLGAMLNHAALTIRGLEERIALYRANYTTNSALGYGRRQIIDDIDKFLRERAALSQYTSDGRVGE